MVLDLELNRTHYNVPRLTFLSWTLTTISLGCIIASHFGSYPEAVDICFYPKAAQLKDAKLKEKHIDAISLNSANIPQNTLLLGTKFCNFQKGDIATIPKSYLLNAQNGSLNESANNKAIISAGLREGWLYQYQSVTAENPYKLPLAFSGFISGIAAMASIQFQKDKQSQLRPMYRATMLLSSKRAGYSLALADLDLKQSAELLLPKLKGIREAETREYFLSKLTDEQAFNLLSSMDSEDYNNFGYLLDDGKSYSRFIDASDAEEEKISAEIQQPPQAVPIASAPPQSAPPQSAETPIFRSNISRFDKYYEIGEQCINGMVGVQRSILLASSSGTGKSTTEKEWIRRMQKQFPEIEFYALVQKAEDLCGLWNQGRMWVYNSNDLLTCLEPIDIVYQIFHQRRSTPGAENTFANKPVRLILGDWFATYTNLLKTNPQQCKDCCTKIGEIITVGRGYNVSVFCDTQSLNLSSLGLVNDSNLRDSLEIFSQGFKHPGKGQFGDGGYNTLRKTIENPYVCSPQNARILLQQMDLLSAAIAKGEIVSPIIFMASLQSPSLGIIPDLNTPIASDESNVQVPEPPKIAYIKSGDNDNLTIKQKVERLLASKHTYVQICNMLWGDKPIEQIAPLLGCQCRLDKIDILSPTAKTLLDILKNKGWMDIHSEEFKKLLQDELAPFQVTDSIKELSLLGYCQFENNQIRALY